MIIYLDESKKLGEGKIVFGGFITRHKNSYIEKYILNKKKQYKIYLEEELKSTKPVGKYFYEKMSDDIEFDIINNNVVGIYVTGYYRDSFESYKDVIENLIESIYKSIKNYNNNILIIADNVSLGKNTRKVELSIEKALNKKFKFYGNYKFTFGNSKSYSGIQLADLFAYKLREYNISGLKMDEFIGENNFNIDYSKEYKIKQ